jgi:hypothetical protein
MSSHFRLPTSTEKESGSSLVNHHIEIYWDGDDTYFSAVVKSYNAKTGLHNVLYDDNDNEVDPQEYEENLKGIKWRIWSGTERDFLMKVYIYLL